MFRHIVPQPVAQPAQRLNNETDEEIEEGPKGNNLIAPGELISPSTAIYKRNTPVAETNYGGRSSPGSKLRESHTK